MEAATSDLDENGRLLGWENLAKHVRSVFHRMGFRKALQSPLITESYKISFCY